MDAKRKFYDDLLKQQASAQSQKLRTTYAPPKSAPPLVEAKAAEAHANHDRGVPSHDEVKAKYGSPLEEPGVLEKVMEFLQLRERQTPQPMDPAALPDKVAPKRPDEESEQFIRRRMGDEAWEEET